MSDMIDEKGVEVKEDEEYCWNDGRVSTEDDGDNRTKSTSLIYQETGYQSSPLSSSDLPEPLSVHQTLNPDDSV